MHIFHKKLDFLCADRFWCYSGSWRFVINVSVMCWARRGQGVGVHYVCVLNMGIFSVGEQWTGVHGT
jgi:hypothetical protein